MGPLVLYVLVGLSLFWVQELVLFPQVYVRPLAPLLFYLGLKGNLSLAFGLALLLGLLQDAYALTPMGFHLVGALILVAGARVARSRMLLRTGGPVALTMLTVLVCQEVVMRLLLVTLVAPEALLEDISYRRGVELLVTAGLTPLFFALFRGLENTVGHLVRSRRHPASPWR
jgi:cell shape-determining protein MreD